MKYFNYLIYSIIIMAWGLTILTIYWLVYPYKIITFSKNHGKILTPVVKRGDALIFQSDFCKYINVGADITRSFINELTYSQPTFQTNVPVGCDKVKRQISVPTTLPPHRYKVQTLYRYQINPLRVIEYKTFSNEFTVE